MKLPKLLKQIPDYGVFIKKTRTMGLLKTALIGAAVYGAIKYITKKDETGRSIMDNIKDKAPEWMEKAKNVKDKFRTELERQRY